MKKFIAILFCFAVIFAFAACTKKPNEGETTNPAVTLPANVVLDENGNPVTKLHMEFATDAKGHPVTDKNGAQLTTYRTEYKTNPAGGIVTNANGDIVTVTDYALVLDENGNPMLGENGEALTTVGFAPVTYPPAPGETIPTPTTVPTTPVGNTKPGRNQKWIAEEFMSKLPKLRDNVDEAIYATTDKGQYANIRINELSYADFLKYIETCKKAGFTQSNTAAVIPEKPEAGKCYRYSSNANGLYITLTYYTDEYPYRTCDLYITVTDYDMLSSAN